MRNPLAELLLKYPTEDAVRAHLAKLRWGSKIICPRCSSTDILKAEGEYECRDCRRTRQRKDNNGVNTAIFTVMTGTFLEDTRSMRNFMLFLFVWLRVKEPTPIARIARSTGLSRTNCNHHMTRVIGAAGEAGLTKADRPKLDEALRALLRVKPIAAPTKLVA